MRERPAEEASGTSRRNFMIRFGVLLNVVGASMLGLPILGYLVAPLRRRAEQAWIPLGRLADYPQGQTRFAEYANPFRVPWDGMTLKTPCWVRRKEDGSFQVFAINCAHLGCPVRWFQESRLFMCPCHGGVYYEDGSRASGPPPRGLFEYQVEVRGEELGVRGGHLPTLATPV